MITLKEGQDARSAAMNGMRKLHSAVAKSMGPAGRNMYFEERDNGYVTKDGATIARWIYGSGLLDKFERVGASILRRASQKTEEEAGDGTTAATVLAYTLVERGIQHVDGGANVISLEKGMREAYAAVEKELDVLSRPAQERADWEKVAYISSRDKEVAEAIGQAMEEVGPEGYIRVEAGDDWVDHDLKMEVKKGMTFPRGYVVDKVINDYKKLTCTLHNAPILVTDLKLFNERDALLLDQLCVQLRKEGMKDLVIIAQLFSGVVKDWLVQANMAFIQSNGQGGMRVLAVESPGFGTSFTEEFCDDIAVMTGAKFFSESRGTRMDSIHMKDLGKCEIIESGAKETHIVNESVDKAIVDQRVAEIKAKHDNATGELEKNRMQQRLAALTKGMAVITVGGRNTENIGEKKARVEDAVLSTKCAHEAGIVPGAGVAVLKAARAIESLPHTDDPDIQLGRDTVGHAVESPLRQIAENCRLDQQSLIEQALDLQDDETLNLQRGKADVVNAFDDGVVDPLKVVKSSLLNAIETAVVILTTETIGVQIPEDAHKRPIFELLTGDAEEAVRKSI